MRTSKIERDIVPLTSTNLSGRSRPSWSMTSYRVAVFKLTYIFSHLVRQDWFPWDQMKEVDRGPSRSIMWRICSSVIWTTSVSGAGSSAIIFTQPQTLSLMDQIITRVKPFPFLLGEFSTLLKKKMQFEFTSERLSRFHWRCAGWNNYVGPGDRWPD